MSCKGFLFTTIASVAIVGAATFAEAGKDQRLLLVTDLDGTLIGGPGGTSKVCRFNVPFATLPVLTTKI